MISNPHFNYQEKNKSLVWFRSLVIAHPLNMLYFVGKTALLPENCMITLNFKENLRLISG